MVTAELAVCLPVLVLLLAVALGTVSVASARVRVADVAREAARLAARGDDAGVAHLEADVAPGIHVGLRRSITDVTATATAKVTILVRPCPQSPSIRPQLLRSSQQVQPSRLVRPSRPACHERRSWLGLDLGAFGCAHRAGLRLHSVASRACRIGASSCRVGCGSGCPGRGRPDRRRWRTLCGGRRHRAREPCRSHVMRRCGRCVRPSRHGAGERPRGHHVSGRWIGELGLDRTGRAARLSSGDHPRHRAR